MSRVKPRENRSKSSPIKIKNFVLVDGHTEKIYLDCVKKYYEKKYNDIDLNLKRNDSVKLIKIEKTKKNETGADNLIKQFEEAGYLGSHEFKNFYFVLDSEVNNYTHKTSNNNNKDIINKDRNSFLQFKKDITEKVRVVLVMNSPCFEYFLFMHTGKNINLQGDTCKCFIEKMGCFFKQKYNKDYDKSNSIEKLFKDNHANAVKELFDNLSYNSKKQTVRELDILAQKNGTYVRDYQDLEKFTNMALMIEEIWGKEIFS